MKLLVADKFPASHLESLEAAGHVVMYQPDLDADSLAGALAGVEGLVVRSTRVTATALSAADTLRLVVRAGTGTNTIDVETATAGGVQVCNVPGMNSLAVAELAFGLIVAIDRNIADNVADLRAGRWDKKRYSQARGLSGRKLGIVGLGGSGLALAERAKAFGMRLAAIDKPRAPDTASRVLELGFELVGDLESLAKQCDIVSLHVPLTEDTHHLVDAKFLNHCQPGAVIINTSRGNLIDEDALIIAMDTKGIRAGLDVFQDEPASGSGEFRSAVASHPNVYGTHHIGASTDQAQDAVAAGTVEVIEAFAAGAALHPVNELP